MKRLNLKELALILCRQRTRFCRIYDFNKLTCRALQLSCFPIKIQAVYSSHGKTHKCQCRRLGRICDSSLLYHYYSINIILQCGKHSESHGQLMQNETVNCFITAGYNLHENCFLNEDWIKDYYLNTICLKLYPITGVLFIHIRLNFVNNIYLNIIRFDYWISLYDFIIIILTKKTISCF